MDLDAIAKIVQSPLGIAGLLLVILYTGSKQWWVFGWQYKEKAKEADDWRTLALRGTVVAERMVKSETGS